jgi:hypothetical protein
MALVIFDELSFSIALVGMSYRSLEPVVAFTPVTSLVTLGPAANPTLRAA